MHLSKSPLLLKSLIDFGSPYVILFSCLIVQIFSYVYFIFNVLLNVYYQGYVVCNLFFLIFFVFYCVYHIHRKKVFSCAKTKTNSIFAVNLAKMLKEATINFCLFDESHFSNI